LINVTAPGKRYKYKMNDFSAYLKTIKQSTIIAFSTDHQHFCVFKKLHKEYQWLKCKIRGGGTVRLDLDPRSVVVCLFISVVTV